MNRLEGAASLYLRQHADNPVDWWPWCDAAFDAARERDVPVFLSIGYAACHWCHVMAHECFEDDRIAARLNEVAVAVKLDREERPDLDAIYMAATQALTGQGGWPMSVFLTPERAPFFAGTYFPPTPRHGLPGFVQLLDAVDHAWRSERAELYAQADRLRAVAAAQAPAASQLAPHRAGGGADRLERLVARLLGRADPLRGGFSTAPKFPHPSFVEACLVAAQTQANGAARDAAAVTLRAMARGGLFDHVGGGFARYSVDADWHVPHFEKMLSDQALLARTYARAATALHDDELAAVARRTLEATCAQFAVDGGYASSLDADAAGHEGAHVVISATDVRDALDQAGLSHLAAATIARYRVEDAGPVDGRSVPRLADGEPFAASGDAEDARAALEARRRRGPQPGRDDKVLLEWNAMLAAALAEGAWRLAEPAFGTAADELLSTLRSTHGAAGRWWRRAGADAPLATAADVAWLVEAHVALAELTGRVAALDDATRIAADLLSGYWDGEVPTAAAPSRGGGLFQSHVDQVDVLVRVHDVVDGAVPSAASIAAVALLRLGRMTEDADLVAVAARLVELGAGLLDAQPDAAPTLVEASWRLDEGLELAVPGAPGEMLGAVRATAPVWCTIAPGDVPIARLDGRDDGVLYRCHGVVCDAPVRDVGSVGAALASAGHEEGRR